MILFLIKIKSLTFICVFQDTLETLDKGVCVIMDTTFWLKTLTDQMYSAIASILGNFYILTHYYYYPEKEKGEQHVEY